MASPPLCLPLKSRCMPLLSGKSQYGANWMILPWQLRSNHRPENEKCELPQQRASFHQRLRRWIGCKGKLVVGNLRFRRSEDSVRLNCLPRKVHSAERLSCTMFLPLLRSKVCRFHVWMHISAIKRQFLSSRLQKKVV